MSSEELELDGGEPDSDEETDREMAKSLALQLLAETRKDVKSLLKASAVYAEQMKALADRVSELEGRGPASSLKRDAGLVGTVSVLIVTVWQLASASGLIKVPPPPPAPVVTAPAANP